VELNRTHQLLDYASTVNLLVVNTNVVKKCTEILLDASKEVGLEAIKLSEYSCLCHHRAGQQRNISYIWERQ
jgi:hypothetical protein